MNVPLREAKNVVFPQRARAIGALTSSLGPVCFGAWCWCRCIVLLPDVWPCALWSLGAVAGATAGRGCQMCGRVQFGDWVLVLLQGAGHARVHFEEVSMAVCDLEPVCWCRCGCRCFGAAHTHMYIYIYAIYICVCVWRSFRFEPLRSLSFELSG